MERNEQKMKEQADKHTDIKGHPSMYNGTYAWCEKKCSWVVCIDNPHGVFEDPKKIVNMKYALYPHYK